MTEEHSSPIKTPKQLVIVVLLGFAVPIALALLVSQLVTSGGRRGHQDDSQILARIQAVGNVVLAAPSAPKGSLGGEQVYAQVCKTCHETGLAGAPKLGDRAAWSARIAQGDAAVFQHAIAGFQGKAGAMPAKGGNADLTDDEVKRAVTYMVNQAGAGWKDLPAPVVAPAAAPVPAAAAERTGEQVVATTCGKCHQTGEGGAPKIGDRAAWIKRVRDGYPRVIQSALRGHAGMPARGGLADLSDAEVKLAVEYMMNSGSAAAVPAATTAAAAPAAPAQADGEKVFKAGCVVCHGAGIAGAPKFGDKAAWAPRIAQGVPVLYTHALGGLTGKAGVMPPKGGNTALTDADVKAAVDYMVAAAR
jgi:cytochrome c5